jgi:hypothetical protein
MFMGIALLFWLIAGIVGSGLIFLFLKWRRIRGSWYRLFAFLPFVPFAGLVTFIISGNASSANPQESFETIFSPNESSLVQPLKGWSSKFIDYEQNYVSFNATPDMIAKLVTHYDLRKPGQADYITLDENDDATKWLGVKNCDDPQLYTAQYSSGAFDKRELKYCPTLRTAFAFAGWID